MLHGQKANAGGAGTAAEDLRRLSGKKAAAMLKEYGLSEAEIAGERRSIPCTSGPLPDLSMGSGSSAGLGAKVALRLIFALIAVKAVWVSSPAPIIQ